MCLHLSFYLFYLQAQIKEQKSKVINDNSKILDDKLLSLCVPHVYILMALVKTTGDEIMSSSLMIMFMSKTGGNQIL